jgi:hypothetical protein
VEPIAQLTSDGHRWTPCHMEVATAEGRKVSRARAPDSPCWARAGARVPSQTEKSPVNRAAGPNGVPASKNACAQPWMSNNSRVRGQITSAWDLSVREVALSTTRTAIPRRFRAIASVRPTGPAPAISTGLFIAWPPMVVARIRLIVGLCRPTSSQLTCKPRAQTRVGAARIKCRHTRCYFTAWHGRRFARQARTQIEGRRLCAARRRNRQEKFSEALGGEKIC